MMKREHYAIQNVGRVYMIKKVTATGLVLPVDCKRYQTLEKAQAAATAMGLKIEKVGDSYEIL